MKLVRERNQAAVLGSPISHSLSPVLHRAAYRDLGLDWSYRAIEVSERGLASFMASLDDTWAGLSLTMPLKTAVLPMLDDASTMVALVGAANTVVIGSDGLRGHNTDVPGMVRALREAGAWDPRTATVLGAGATARSAVAAAVELGAAAVTVVLRDPSRGSSAVGLGRRLGIDVDLRRWAPDHATTLLDADVVIATVPPGAGDAWIARIPDHPGVLLDVAYDPWPTPLVTAWRARGGAAADGLDLLLWQAVDQVELMTGQRPDADVMRTALRAAAASR